LSAREYPAILPPDYNHSTGALQFLWFVQVMDRDKHDAAHCCNLSVITM